MGPSIYSIYTIYIHDISQKWPIKALFSFSFPNLANWMEGLVMFLSSLYVLVFVSDYVG